MQWEGAKRKKNVDVATFKAIHTHKIIIKLTQWHTISREKDREGEKER